MKRQEYTLVFELGEFDVSSLELAQLIDDLMGKRFAGTFQHIVWRPTPEPAWQPIYSAWRLGGWYVDNIRYPGGAVGCVSRNYPDKKWRIVCDPRPFDTAPTFKCRDDAARAERELAAASVEVAR